MDKITNRKISNQMYNYLIIYTANIDSGLIGIEQLLTFLTWAIKSYLKKNVAIRQPPFSTLYAALFS